MTDKKSRRAVIINNIDSDTIDQAIFILKSDSTSSKSFAAEQKSIAAEAQQIIDNYIRQVDRLKDGVTPSFKTKKKHTRRAPLFWFAFFTISVLCIGVSIALIGNLS